MMSHEFQKLVTTLLASTCVVCPTKVTVAQEYVPLQLTATAPTARCPRCAVPLSSVHSYYQRRLTVIPWGMRPVRIQLRVRKFVCCQLSCVRRIFTERLPELVAMYARKTRGLVTSLQAIGVALGGHAGARLAARLRPPTSVATLLRLVCAALVPHTPALQVVGLDEWAWRRGRCYGTIVVNLADHRVVDLLPDRAAATVAAWLAQHPTVSVVCRDRSALYADGIRHGLPDTRQVVDRFHLVHNLCQAVEAVLVNQRSMLQAVAAGTAIALTPAIGPMRVTPMYRGQRQSPQTERQRVEAARQQHHGPRVPTYAAVHALHAQGMPVATIARALGLSRPTAYTSLCRDRPLGPARPQFRRSDQVLTPYVPFYHAPASCWGGWTSTGTPRLAIHPSPRAIRPCGVVRHGVPRREAVA